MQLAFSLFRFNPVLADLEADIIRSELAPFFDAFSSKQETRSIYCCSCCCCNLNEITMKLLSSSCSAYSAISHTSIHSFFHDESNVFFSTQNSRHFHSSSSSFSYLPALTINLKLLFKQKHSTGNTSQQQRQGQKYNYFSRKMPESKSPPF